MFAKTHPDMWEEIKTSEMSYVLLKDKIEHWTSKVSDNIKETSEMSCELFLRTLMKYQRYWWKHRKI